VILAIDLLYEFIAVYMWNMQLTRIAKIDCVFSLHHKHILHPEPQTSVVAQLRPLTQLSLTIKDNAKMPEIEPYAGGV
jgi:hypothetical protein